MTWFINIIIESLSDLNLNSLIDHSTQKSIFLLGTVIYSNAYFGPGTGPILLDDLLCTGSETRLIDCPRYFSGGIGTYDGCRGHLDDAGVRCMQCKSQVYSISIIVC